MPYENILKNLKETPPRALNDHILIVDAMNTLIRSFSLLKAMNPSGAHIGGLVGFLRSLGYVTRIFDPTRVLIIWDGKGGSSNRKNIDPNYKAQRATSRITHWGLYDNKEEETEALIGQLFRTQDYLECLPLQQIVIEKLEADDIIAYLAKRASNAGKKVTIVSSDKDLMQLFKKDVRIFDPMKNKFVSEEDVLNKFGVNPEKVFDIITESMEVIYEGDELHYIKDQTVEEVNDFINNLTSDQFAKVRQFFETIPSMKKEIEYTCPNCGRVHKKTLEGLQSFFG